MTSAGAAEVVGTATSVGSGDNLHNICRWCICYSWWNKFSCITRKRISKLFAEHNHPSSVGPTGPLSPQFASKLIQTMSKKVFLSWENMPLILPTLQTDLINIYEKGPTGNPSPQVVGLKLHKHTILIVLRL